MKIEDVYNELYEQNVCKSGYEFSRDYLGKNENYFSVCKARKKEPSVEALVTLSLALQHRSQSLSRSDNAQIRKTGTKLAEMHGAVSDAVISACKAKIA